MSAPHSDTTEHLFERYRRNGDAADLAAVFDRTAPALLAVARRLVRSRNDAEDLVQSTFVTAIERANAYDPSRAIVPWLIGILAGHAKNAARAAARARPQVSVEVVESESVLDSLVALEERSAVAVALSELPEPYRSLVKRRLALAPNTDSRATSKGTLRVQFHRALERMRRLLPASLLGGALAATLDRRAIAAVRARILGSATPVSATAGSMLLVGGMLVWKKVVLVAVVVIACGWIARDFVRPTAIAPPVVENEPMAPVIAAAPAVAPATATRELVAASATSPLASPASATAVRVTGRVIDDATGAPVENAACFAGHVNSLQDDLPKTAVRTDRDGFFTIPNADYDRFDTAIVVAPDYAPLRYTIERAVKTGVERDGVALGDLRLVRGGTIRGRVIDAAGTPVSAARLLLFDLRAGVPEFIAAGGRSVGSSRADGSFELDHVPPSRGRWRLFALSERGCGGVEVDVLADVGFSMTVEIALSAAARLDIEVVTGSGEAIEGATVAAVPIGEPWVLGDWRNYAKRDPFPARSLGIAWDPRLPAEFRTLTDLKGLASIGVLPAELPCTVVVWKKDHQPFYADIVTVSRDAPTTLRATLSRMAAFPVSGRVVDLAGAPLSDVAVERYGVYQGNKSKRQDETRTDAAGCFRFDGIPAGTIFELCVGKPGIARRGLRFTVPANRGLEDVVLVAKPSASIKGIVVDDAGTPIPDAFVNAQSGNDYVKCDEWSTDTAGAFLFSNTTEGTWQLSAGMPGPAENWREPWVEREVEAGESNVRIVGIRETPGRAEVSIEIIDSVTQQPLEPREAGFGPRPRATFSRVVQTRAVDGRERGLVRIARCKPGAWRLLVKCEGYPKAFLDFDVAPADALLKLRLEVSPPSSVMGRITADGVSAEQLERMLVTGIVRACHAGGVILQNSDDFVPSMIRLVGATEFRFEQVPSGPLVIDLAGGELVGSVRIDAKPRAESVVEIAAVKPGTVKTRGAQRFDKVFATLCLSCEDRADAWIVLGLQGVKSPEGSQRLAPGSWRWRFGYASADTTPRPDMFDLPVVAEGAIEIRAGETTEIVLPDPPR